MLHETLDAKGSRSLHFIERDPGRGKPMAADVVRISNVERRRVEWLWPQRIALGKLTLVAGEPGVGKSFLTLDLAARVSRGWGMPGEGEQGAGSTEQGVGKEGEQGAGSGNRSRARGREQGAWRQASGAGAGLRCRAECGG